MVSQRRLSLPLGSMAGKPVVTHLKSFLPVSLSLSLFRNPESPWSLILILIPFSLFLSLSVHKYGKPVITRSFILVSPLSLFLSLSCSIYLCLSLYLSTIFWLSPLTHPPPPAPAPPHQITYRWTRSILLPNRMTAQLETEWEQRQNGRSRSTIKQEQMTSTDEDNGASPATTPRVLAAVTAALERLVSRNNSLAASEDATEPRRRPSLPANGPLDVFRAARVPSISVGSYLERLYQYADCSPSCFVLGFVYMDRLAHQHPSSLVLSVNVHRLILASIVVASKVLDDVYVASSSSSSWSPSSG